MTGKGSAFENHRKICDYVRDNPGSHLRRISRDLDIDLGNLRHHLEVLERNGLVESKMDRNLKIYFATGLVEARSRTILPLLQQKRFRDVILHIILNPRSAHREIADDLELKPSTLSKYIGILEDRDILRHESHGRERLYFVTDERRIMELLLAYRRSFWDKFVDNVLDIYFE